MKQRILYGWTIRRVLYTLMGIAVIVQAIREEQWWWILLGAYFAGMGIFSFGCASGACATNSYGNIRKDTNPVAQSGEADSEKMR